MDYCLAEPKRLLVPVGPLQQTAAYSALCISVVLFCIFHTDTKLCKSITVVLMVLFKKKKRKKEKKANGENQPIIVCTELKIVINRACLKKKNNCCLFSCIKENL